ncbi:hypothetical protein DFJ58DRAFT_733291 [Suillus subalutaceus]|uniref:uncharacterized protein n=1 Tax=Suillus subalutaceus TaxID=48586 RepID=UPI001B86C61E|nr:uncharacterized protein DFJ58DRAFT_733291 [Suillus subalutaceus]KAG1839568.1 hypothetical protein DFJ58DRAFT_733291 [Suillus subalutaceus]
MFEPSQEPRTVNLISVRSVQNGKPWTEPWTNLTIGQSGALIFKLKKKQSHADMLDDDSDTAEPQFRGKLVDIELKKRKNTNGKTVGRPRTNMLEKDTFAVQSYITCSLSKSRSLAFLQQLHQISSHRQLTSEFSSTLKIVVEAEFKSQHNPTLKGKTAADVREAFVRQFECYVKGQYPFDVMVDAGQGILSYWTHLTKIPEGCILACIAEKIYSIKPSSIPEEQTMSVFTRMNTAARNRQHVRTLVDMTQIRQWHMYDPKKMVERRHPDISFGNLDSIISTGPKEPAAHQSHEPTGSYLSVGTDEEEEILEDEKDTWLDEKLAAEPAQDSAFDIEVDANLRAPIVTKALSDECKESPINGLGGDATEDDADLEDKDTEWGGKFW